MLFIIFIWSWSRIRYHELFIYQINYYGDRTDENVGFLLTFMSEFISIVVFLCSTLIFIALLTARQTKPNADSFQLDHFNLFDYVSYIVVIQLNKNL